MFTSYEFFASTFWRSVQRMKMPLLASSSTQNSARTWKSVYELFETRKPWRLSPLSAITAPSAILQLALPIGLQLSRLDPSKSTVQAGPDDMDEQAPSASAAIPMTSSDSLFIATPPLVCFLKRPDFPFSFCTALRRCQCRVIPPGCAFP